MLVPVVTVSLIFVILLMTDLMLLVETDLMLLVLHICMKIRWKAWMIWTVIIMIKCESGIVRICTAGRRWYSARRRPIAIPEFVLVLLVKMFCKNVLLVII